MSMEFNQYQFGTPHGDEHAKKKLLKQMGKTFPEDSLQWLTSPDVRVERREIPLADIDNQGRETWAATHEPKKVKQKRKEIKHGDIKPIVAVDRPGHDDLFIMDGHHHYEAAQQLSRKEYPGYVVKVPRTTGPWDVQHDKQLRTKDA